MTIEIPFDRSLIPPGSRVLCAVSGGADSVCLLDRVRSLGDVECACAHYDHGLRPESAEDAAFTAGLCEKWGVPFFTERGDVAALARDTGKSLETAAREARYAFLYRAAAAWGADRIATAHTMNDNAETVLFRMARGTGLRGLTGIPAERGRLVRPLLRATRAQIEEYLRERDIPWREDATNALDDAARNRVRHHLLPDLAMIHPGALENVDRMIRSLGEDEAYLTSLAEDWLAKRGDELPAGELRALPRSVSARVLRLWLGGELSARGLESVLDLCGASPSAMLDLPGRRIWRRGEVLTRKEPEEKPLPAREIRPGERLALPEIEASFNVPRGVAFRDASNIVVSDHVYKRDIFSLRGMESVKRSYTLACTRRGRYPVSRITLRSWSFLHSRRYAIRQANETCARSHRQAPRTDRRARRASDRDEA